MRQFQAGEEAVHSLAFTTDGRSLMWVEGASRLPGAVAVHWLDRRTGDTQRKLDLREYVWRRPVPYGQSCPWTSPAVVSPDGRWVAVRRCGSGPPVALDLWDARTGAWSPVHPGGNPYSTGAVCYSAGSDLLVYATVTEDEKTRAIERLDLAADRRLPAIRFRGRNPTWHLRLSAGERLLAVDSSGGVAVLRHDRGWGVAGGTVVLKHDGKDTAIEFSPGGEELAVRVDAGLLLWDCRSPTAVAVPVDGGRQTAWPTRPTAGSWPWATGTAASSCWTGTGSSPSAATTGGSAASRRSPSPRTA